MSQTYEGTVTGGSYGALSIVFKSINNSQSQAMHGRQVKVTVIDTPESVLAELVKWWDDYAESSSISMGSKFPKGSEIITRARALAHK